MNLGNRPDLSALFRFLRRPAARWVAFTVRRRPCVRFCACQILFIGFFLSHLAPQLLADATNTANNLTNAVVAEEEIAFKAAAQEFNVGLYEKAAKDFAEFAKRFTNSDRIPEVLLCQAQAQFRLKQYESVIKGLEASLGRAGKIPDKFRLLIADAHFQREDFPNAAAAYAQLLKDYPDSFLKANASYSEALSWFRQGNLSNTIARLQPPGSVFQKIAQTQTNDEFVLRGYLLLAEVFLRQNDLRQAEEALKVITGREQPPQIAWQRQYLMARILLSSNRAGEAVPGLTNLENAAKATGDAASQADTVLLQGQILQAANQLPNAIQLYEQQRAGLPAKQQQEVLLQLIAWHTQLGNLMPAIASLELFAGTFTNYPAIDQIRLSLGEMRVKQYLAFTPGNLTNATEIAAARANILNQAQASLDLIITSFPKSAGIGQAQLFRGWCFWESGKIAESRDAYKDAAEKLPLSTNQMNARFQYAQALSKLAETTNSIGNRTNAIANYWIVASQYGALTNAPAALIEQSLYQIVRASEPLGDAVTAGKALDQLLKDYPQSSLGDRCLMLAGQILELQEHAPEARNRYADLLKKYPASALAPEARLALAHSFMRDGNWEAALAEYDGWIAQYTNHAKLPDVEYDRAWTCGQAKHETNAYALFTNFVARFPNHPKGQLARFWIGHYFFDQGKYQDAEENFQLLYQNTNYPAGEMKYQAKLYAGAAAYNRQAYQQASDYFVDLIKNLQKQNSPPELLAMAYIAYGDNLRTEASTDKTNALANFSEAINAYSKIPDTNRYAPQAWGLIADCSVQLGAVDPVRYTNALENYAKILAASNANISLRSEAKVGVGLVHEILAANTNRPPADQAALLKTALDHYLDVAFGKNLAPGETPDPFWVLRAGLAAGNLLSKRGQWAETANHYERLLKILPDSAKESIRKKLEYARKQAG
jgi:TolA-binding protein